MRASPRKGASGIGEAKRALRREQVIFWVSVAVATGAIGTLSLVPSWSRGWIGWLEAALLGGVAGAGLLVAGRVLARQAILHRLAKQEVQKGRMTVRNQGRVWVVLLLMVGLGLAGVSPSAGAHGGEEKAVVLKTAGQLRTIVTL